MVDYISIYFVQTGLGWAVAGAILAVMLGGVGSARGIRIAGAQGAGVLSEKPELFGKLLILMALPGTQGFYGFICAIMISLRSGIIAGNVNLPPLIGFGLFCIGLFMGIVQWQSGINQGEASAASINLTAKRPEEGGRAILIPALVETYAVVALLASILLIIWITNEGLVFQDSQLKFQ